MTMDVDVQTNKQINACSGKCGETSIFRSSKEVMINRICKNTDVMYARWRDREVG